MNNSFRKIFAFIKRDFLVESSYKVNFFLDILKAMIPLISFFFIEKMIPGESVEGLKKYGGNFFSFVFIGVAFTEYFRLAISTFSNKIKAGQAHGTLEATLSTKTNINWIILFSSLYNFLSEGLKLLIILFICIFFFSLDLSKINLLATFVTFLFSMLIFISIGIFSAAGTIVFKKGEPVSWFFGGLSSLFGGAFFPIEVMPDWLQTISKFIPTTYTLDALRLSMLQGYSLSQISSQLLILGVLAIILFPLSIKAFRMAVNKGKYDGTLIHF